MAISVSTPWTIRVWQTSNWTDVEWHWETTVDYGGGFGQAGSGKTGYRWTAKRAAKRFCRNAMKRPVKPPKPDRYNFSFVYRVPNKSNR